MDPHATWRDMMTAFNHGDIAEAQEHAENLDNWIKGGGFFEMKVGGLTLDRPSVENLIYLIQCGLNWQEERN